MGKSNNATKLLLALSAERQQVQQAILALENFTRLSAGAADAASHSSNRAASRTQALDSESMQAHDFCNLVQELRYAAECQDRMMMEYCGRELERMCRQRRAKRERAALTAS
jgi:hypothetical protein